ncbi:hypothetical protein AB4225_36625 [Streptomyces sp. 2RAF24]|uniref:hypothetical protein n=1 Tax=Streptomyces sp. 2RAF24 TaxID=3232997 RepID=UPI003F94C807
MRWERGQDPVTWTAVDNAMIDADLSARAQGLLLRWLRRPPGAEIDDIPEMVKRSKRAGKKRLEGRDALYKASYELEEEGFLVRERDRGRGGQYEWVVRIYSSPVPLERRSNPEDRKRAPRSVPASQNRRSAPVPENPELVNQEPVDQEPGNQDSADQGFSFKNSVNDSLSGLDRPSGDGSEAGGEREAATPEDNPAGADAAAAAASEDADAVVAAYERALGRGLSARSAARLRAQAVRLLESGLAAGWLAERAAEMPAKGWTDLELHADHPRHRLPGQGAAPRPERERDASMCWKPGHGAGAFRAEDCGECLAESRPRREGGPSKLDTDALILKIRAAAGARAGAEGR